MGGGGGGDGHDIVGVGVGVEVVTGVVVGVGVINQTLSDPLMNHGADHVATNGAIGGGVG